MRRAGSGRGRGATELALVQAGALERLAAQACDDDRQRLGIVVRVLCVVDDQPDRADHPSFDAQRHRNRRLCGRRQRRRVREHLLELLPTHCPQRTALARRPVQHPTLGEPEHLPVRKLEALGLRDHDLPLFDEPERDRRADHRLRLADERGDDLRDARRCRQRGREALERLEPGDRSLAAAVAWAARSRARRRTRLTQIIPSATARPTLHWIHASRCVMSSESWSRDDEDSGSRPREHDAQDPGADTAVPHGQRHGADEDRVDGDLPFVRERDLRDDRDDRGEDREPIPRRVAIARKAVLTETFATQRHLEASAQIQLRVRKSTRVPPAIAAIRPSAPQKSPGWSNSPTLKFIPSTPAISVPGRRSKDTIVSVFTMSSPLAHLGHQYVERPDDGLAAVPRGLRDLGETVEQRLEPLPGFLGRDAAELRPRQREQDAAVRDERPAQMPDLRSDVHEPRERAIVRGAAAHGVAVELFKSPMSIASNARR